MVAKDLECKVRNKDEKNNRLLDVFIRML
jgi:hypothetical protein